MKISLQESIALNLNQDPAIIPFFELKAWINRVWFVEEDRDFLLSVLVTRVVLESLTDVEGASKIAQEMTCEKSKALCLAAIHTRVLLDNGAGFNSQLNGSPQ